MVSINPEDGGRAAFDSMIRQLLTADWEQADGSITLGTDLELAELDGAPHFHNARILLRALAEGNGTPMTAAGNLNREFVKRMFESMQMPGIARESILHMNKVINEADVRDLSLLRDVCLFGGLIARRQKRFYTTRRARALLGDAKAGALYRQLFLAFFRKLDLSSMCGFREVPGIQQTLAVILWRLNSVAAHWTPVSVLAEKVLLPAVLAEVRSTFVSEYETEDQILLGYVLDPLLDFGLIEVESKSDWPGVVKIDAIRISPLWRRFLRFAPTV